MQYYNECVNHSLRLFRACAPNRAQSIYLLQLETFNGDGLLEHDVVNDLCLRKPSLKRTVRKILKEGTLFYAVEGGWRNKDIDQQIARIKARQECARLNGRKTHRRLSEEEYKELQELKRLKAESLNGKKDAGRNFDVVRELKAHAYLTATESRCLIIFERLTYWHNGLLPREAVIDYLKQKPRDGEAVEKVLRQYFVEIEGNWYSELIDSELEIIQIRRDNATQNAEIRHKRLKNRYAKTVYSAAYPYRPIAIPSPESYQKSFATDCSKTISSFNPATIINATIINYRKNKQKRKNQGGARMPQGCDKYHWEAALRLNNYNLTEEKLKTIAIEGKKLCWSLPEAIQIMAENSLSEISYEDWMNI
jgi:uncharacterized protein YdaU (DUF1376 family)